MFMHDASLEACRALVEEHAPRAARDLATLEPDAVVFSCTGAGALLGESGEAELVERLAELARAPVVSTNEAVTRMIDAHGPARVAVLTPYVPDVIETVVAARERAGHRVVHAAGMGIPTNREIARVEPAELLEFAGAELRDVDFDLLFISCTNLRTAPVVEPLERRFGVPVVTSNLASCRAALEVMRAVRA
jgi:maleate isomerase